LRYALPDMPPIVIGKPNRPFLDSIEKIHKLDKSRTIMVGDRLDTDVSLRTFTVTVVALIGMSH
jgi:4-nitrophenyl phosphatase